MAKNDNLWIQFRMFLSDTFLIWAVAMVPNSHPCKLAILSFATAYMSAQVDMYK